MFLDLSHIHLLSGAWAEGLDVLRIRANSESRLRFIRGAESNSISDNQINRIFGYDAQASWVNQYIQGISIVNPFLAIGDETMDEGMDSDTI